MPIFYVLFRGREEFRVGRGPGLLVTLAFDLPGFGSKISVGLTTVVDGFRRDLPEGLEM